MYSKSNACLHTRIACKFSKLLRLFYPYFAQERGNTSFLSTNVSAGNGLSGPGYRTGHSYGYMGKAY